jgi:hypothetical protein
MKMKIKEQRVLFGALVLFIIAALWAFWPTVNAEKLPLHTAAVTPIDSTVCIASTEYMRSHHMQILDDWRRTGARDSHPYVTQDGKKFQKSLDTCLGCHGNNRYFCISCHMYANAKPNCWNCHQSPLEKP